MRGGGVDETPRHSKGYKKTILSVIVGRNLEKPMLCMSSLKHDPILHFRKNVLI